MAPRIAAPARAHHRCVVGGDLAVFHHILNFLVYFAIFSILYRGFAVVFLIRDFLIQFAVFIFYTGFPVFIYATRRTEKKPQVEVIPDYVSVIMKHRPNRKNTTGSANHIA